MYKNNTEVQDNIVSQLSYYTEAIDSFGTDMAIRQRKVATISPARWWTVHGTSAKDLKKMAIRIRHVKEIGLHLRGYIQRREPD